MMSALAWLGGTESDVIFQSLAGQWVDERNGSMYHLTISEGEIDVHTLRSSGRQIFTKGLIRWRGGKVVWGKYPQREFKMVEASNGRVAWYRGRRSQFVWKKLQ